MLFSIVSATNLHSHQQCARILFFSMSSPTLVIFGLFFFFAVLFTQNTLLLGSMFLYYLL